jgi:hypothetical protein
MRMMPRAQMMLTTAMLCQVVGVVANLLLPRHVAQCHPLRRLLQHNATCCNMMQRDAPD